MGVTIEPRGGGNGLLPRLVDQGLRGFRQLLDQSGRSLPAFVWRALERLVDCGDPDKGFLWLVCDSCPHHRLVPFSCKGRGICPRRVGGLRCHDRWPWPVLRPRQMGNATGPGADAVTVPVVALLAVGCTCRNPEEGGGHVPEDVLLPSSGSDVIYSFTGGDDLLE